MENLEKLSNGVFSVTCSCGIVFETYDPKKMYHSNKCRAIHVRRRNAAKVQRQKLKQKKLREQSFH
jgi:hypothetical protein